MTVGNVGTRGVNPSMAGGVYPFLESNDPGSVGDSMISSMTTEKGSAEVTLPRCFVGIRPNLSSTQLI